MVDYPKDWELKKIGELLTVQTGIRDLKDKVQEGKYPFYVRSNIIEKINSYDFNTEAVLTAGDGNIGEVFHYINGKFSAHQRVYVIHNFNKVQGKFFYYWFSNSFIKQAMKFTAKATVDSIRKPTITEMSLPVPSISEQQAIADTLSAFDEHIDNLTELIEKKKAIRDGALEDLVTGKVRLDGFDCEWETQKLSNISKIYDGTHQTPKYVDKGVPFVSVENIRNLSDTRKYISEFDFKRDFRVYPEFGDILITRIGDIGTPAIVKSNKPLAYYVSLALLKSIRISSAFLKYHILGSTFKKELDDRTLHHAVPIKINKNEIGECLVYFPKDLKEQKSIASILTAMDEELDNLEREKEKILQMKAGAMDDLLTGKIRLV